MTGTSITKKGLKLITKILASGEELNFTRAAVGTGSVPAGYDKENMIGLAAYKMDGTISRCVSDPENQQASIVLQISSVGVSEGFTVTEAGIYANDPDEGEILYAYTDMTEDPQYIYPEDSEISKFMELTLVVVIGSVERVTAYINPGSLVTSEEFYALKKEIEDGKTTTEFTEASDRENIKSGETTSIIFGKIKKWFADLKDAAFATIVNHCLATEPGTVLDGRVGKDLQEQIDELKEADEAINSNISVIPEFIMDESGKITGYKTEAGADTVFPFINEDSIQYVQLSSNQLEIKSLGHSKSTSGSLQINGLQSGDKILACITKMNGFGSTRSISSCWGNLTSWECNSSGRISYSYTTYGDEGAGTSLLRVVGVAVIARKKS